MREQRAGKGDGKGLWEVAIEGDGRKEGRGTDRVGEKKEGHGGTCSVTSWGIDSLIRERKRMRQ